MAWRGRLRGLVMLLLAAIAEPSEGVITPPYACTPNTPTVTPTPAGPSATPTQTSPPTTTPGCFRLTLPHNSNAQDAMGSWEVMKRHPLTGAQIVAPFEFFSAGALIIRHHHERLDGTGYPDGLVGGAIPLGARIIAVADVWDALTSDRPYRAALPPAKARAYLCEQSGITLDSGAVDTFLSLDLIPTPLA